MWARCFKWIDAVAIGCWSAVGTQRTPAVGLDRLPAILLGTITAVGGSAVRDVVVQRIPGIFGGRTLYATSALAGSSVLVVLHVLGLPTAGLVAGTVIGAALTLVADRRGWQLRGAYHVRPGSMLLRSRIRRRRHRAHRATSRSRASDSLSEPAARHW